MFSRSIRIDNFLFRIKKRKVYLKNKLLLFENDKKLFFNNKIVLN